MAKDSHARAKRRAKDARRYLDNYIMWGYIGLWDVAYECRHNDFTQEEFFALQEKYQREDLTRAKKSLDMSRWGGEGKRTYKKPYRRWSRRQGKAICQAYMDDDEQRAERIVPEGFVGSIGWDIW